MLLGDWCLMSRHQHGLIFGHLTLAKDIVMKTLGTHHLVMRCHIPE